MDYRSLLTLYIIYTPSTRPNHVSIKSQNIDLPLQIWANVSRKRDFLNMFAERVKQTPVGVHTAVRLAIRNPHRQGKHCPATGLHLWRLLERGRERRTPGGGTGPLLVSRSLKPYGNVQHQAWSGNPHWFQPSTPPMWITSRTSALSVSLTRYYFFSQVFIRLATRFGTLNEPDTCPFFFAASLSRDAKEGSHVSVSSSIPILSLAIAKLSLSANNETRAFAKADWVCLFFWHAK